MLELNRIYKGDCLELMKELDDNSVDLVLTDPPYNIEQAEWDKKNKKELRKFNLSWMKEIKRIIKNKHPILIFNVNGELLSDFINISSEVLRFKKFITLYKPNDCSFPLQSVLRTSEALLLYSNNGAINYKSERNIHDCLIYNRKIDKRFYHPSVKPIEAIEVLIRAFTLIDGTVLDPFMGSGTTAVACKKLYRNFIGFEINPKYVTIAEKRLSKTKPMDAKELRRKQMSLSSIPSSPKGKSNLEEFL